MSSMTSPQPQRWPDQGSFAAWLGHSTVLLKMDGFTVLTDPVFSDTVGLKVGSFALGARRLVAPALELTDLPKIDLILLSHAHMDHFDLDSLRRLENRNTAVITAPRTAGLLRTERWARVRELRWDEESQEGPLTVRAIEVNHWGARLQVDFYRGYNGYLLSAGRRRIVFAGDTAATSAFSKLRSSRPIDLAIMPIGAYDPWVWFHCTPEQAWNMANDAGAELIMPVHHQTFRLSRERLAEPIERLYAAAGRAASRIAVQRIGEECWLN